MRRFSRFGFVRRKAVAKESQALMSDLNLRPLNIERPIGQFSGGNQQKAIIGRWIAAGAQILLFDEPTRGIDVGAKAEIYALIERLAAEGRSMIVVSSELPEIMRVADRVLVMREGRIAGVLERDSLSEEAIVALAVPQSSPSHFLRCKVLSHVYAKWRRRKCTSQNKFALPVGLRDAGTLMGLVVIVVVFSILSPNFLTQQNILNILQQSSINACVALGMTLVIIAGGIDLSVGPTAAIAAVVVAVLMAAGVPIAVAIPLALIVGMTAGAFNGVLVAYGGLQPFIVTLGTLSLYRAIALIYTGGNPIFGIPPEFRALTNSSILGVPSPVLIIAVLALVVWVVLNKTPLGEYFLAVGGNQEASRIAGVPVAHDQNRQLRDFGGLGVRRGSHSRGPPRRR